MTDFTIVRAEGLMSGPSRPRPELVGSDTLVGAIQKQSFADTGSITVRAQQVASAAGCTAVVYLTVTDLAAAWRAERKNEALQPTSARTEVAVPERTAAWSVGEIAANAMLSSTLDCSNMG